MPRLRDEDVAQIHRCSETGRCGRYDHEYENKIASWLGDIMKVLWNAFVARLTYWLTPKPPAPVIVQAPEPPLKPGVCECEHDRCNHVGGKGKCTVAYPADLEWPDGAICSCEIYIRDDDNDDGDEPETPTPSELQKLYRL